MSDAPPSFDRFPRSRSGGIVRSTLVGMIFFGALLCLLWMLFFRFAVERELKARTGFGTEIEQLYCNPFSGRIKADTIAFWNPAGFPNSEFMRITELDVEIKPLSVRNPIVSIPKLSLVMDQLSLVVTETGQMNTRTFSDSLDGPAGSAPSTDGSGPAGGLDIEHLIVEIKSVDVEDLSSGIVYVRRYRPNVRREFRHVTDLDEVVRTLLGDLLQAGLGPYAPGVLAVVPARLAGPAGPVFLQDDERLKNTMDSVIELLKNRFDSSEEGP